MSEENDDTQNKEGKGIAQLREEFEKQAKEIAALREQNATLLTEKRTGSVTDALKAKGLAADKAAKLTKFYSGDDASEEAVGKWLEENADVFGVTQAQEPAPGGNPDPNAANAQKVSQAAFGSATSNVQTPSTQAPIGDPAELQRLYQTAPMEQLQALGLMPKNLNPYQSATDGWD